MPRQATGEVIERDRQAGRLFALHFRAHGRRHFLTVGGAPTAGRGQGRAELRHVLADVERGLWMPDVDRALDAPTSPTFHEFASESLEVRRASCATRRSPTTRGTTHGS